MTPPDRPSSRPPDGHPSADALIAFAAGLLSGGAEARVVAHLGSCAACRESFESLTDREDWEEPAGEHVPAAMLASWPRTKRELRGVERDLVLKHLERCDSCHAELATLGFEPEPGPRPRAETVRQPLPAAREGAARRGRETRGHGWRRHMSWTPWALGGWASGSKYSLLGGVRSAAQMIAYEVFMGLSLMGVVALAGSFRSPNSIAWWPAFAQASTQAGSPPLSMRCTPRSVTSAAVFRPSPTAGLDTPSM